MAGEDQNFTKLLDDVRSGAPDAAEALFPAVYDTLRRLARRQLAGERIDHTLQPTALVNEAYLKLTGRSGMPFNDRAHFFRAAAAAMRQILIDHAKSRGRVKRDGKLKMSLVETADVAARVPPEEMLTIDEAICRLEQLDAGAASIVRMRFYIGLSLAETADAVGVSVSTVRRDWAFARAFLYRELCQD